MCIRDRSTRWKTYVANRVDEIQRLTQTYTWHHINSRHNPADIISRGCLPDVVRDCSLWWHGPSCLSQSSESNPFPSFVPCTPSSYEVTAEEKHIHNLSLMSILAVDLSLDFSSLHRLTRVYAYCCLLYTSRCV